MHVVCTVHPTQNTYRMRTGSVEQEEEADKNTSERGVNYLEERNMCANGKNQKGHNYK